MWSNPAATYSSYKRARAFNKAPLKLQSRIQSGSSLPMQTVGRMYFKGSGTVNFFDQNPGTNAFSPSDQIFTLNNVRSVTTTTIANMQNFRGSFSYRKLWQMMYQEALVLGSSAKFRINKPLYPSQVIAVRPTDDGGVAAGELPADATYGFWYIRYHYARAGADGANVPVGAPLRQHDLGLWANMRDFQQDASVTYVRDKLPKTTRICQQFNHIPHDGLVRDLWGGEPAALRGPITYEMEFSNKPITFNVKYSAKKHFQDQNVLRNGSWSNISPTGPADPGIANSFQVKIGYIAFDSVGRPAYCVPVDGQFRRFVELEIEYCCALRTPLSRPWDPLPNNQPNRMPNPLDVPNPAFADAEDIDLPNIPDDITAEADTGHEADDESTNEVDALIEQTQALTL